MIKGNFHRLLRRQIKDHLGQLDQISASDLQEFLEIINSAYINFDQDIEHIENILKQSSQELFKKNKELNALNTSLNVTVEKKTAHLSKVSYNLKSAERIANLGNFTWDIESRHLDLSDQLVRMLKSHGIESNKGIKYVIRHFENADGVIKTIIKTVKRKGSFKFERVKLLNKNSYFHFEGRIIKNSQNGSMLIGILQDISNTVLAEEKSNELKTFYETILNSLPPNVMVLDKQQNYIFINPSAIPDASIRKTLIGKNDFDCLELLDMDITQAIHTQSKFYDAVSQKQEIGWEETVIGKEGSKKSILKRFVPILDQEQKVIMVIGYGIDISERMEMEEKQVLLSKQLSHQNEQLNDFVSIVSHNLRGPLVNISMLIKFIQESQDTEEKEEMIDKIEPVINSLNEVFNELVESLQIKQDHSIKLEINDLKKAIQLICQGLDVEIGKSNAQIQIEVEEAPTLRFPSKYLKSILHNLIGNALKYQSPKRSPIIQIKTKKFNDVITLSIQDNGLGIDLEKHKNNLFKIGKVFHKHPAAKGFGLYMTKTQIESMNGHIWIESSPDKGSTFYVDFVNQ